MDSGDLELLERLPPLYSRRTSPNPPVLVKVFLPELRWEFGVLEGGYRGAEFLLFGLLFEPNTQTPVELTVPLSWFCSLRGPFGFPVTVKWIP